MKELASMEDKIVQCINGTYVLREEHRLMDENLCDRIDELAE